MKAHSLNNPPQPIPKPLPNKEFDQYISKEDNDFIKNLNEIELSKLIDLANQLECQELLDLLLGSVAAQFIGYTMDDFRKEYDIKEEFTKEIEA